LRFWLCFFRHCSLLLPGGQDINEPDDGALALNPPCAEFKAAAFFQRAKPLDTHLFFCYVQGIFGATLCSFSLPGLNPQVGLFVFLRHSLSSCGASGQSGKPFSLASRPIAKQEKGQK
jgi:hypothetical protein